VLRILLDILTGPSTTNASNMNRTPQRYQYITQHFRRPNLVSVASPFPITKIPRKHYAAFDLKPEHDLLL